MNACKVDGCDRPAEWHVLRTVRHDRIFGEVHDGSHYAPYRINHVRQGEYCDDHARPAADEMNRLLI